MTNALVVMRGVYLVKKKMHTLTSTDWQFLIYVHFRMENHTFYGYERLGLPDMAKRTTYNGPGARHFLKGI